MALQDSFATGVAMGMPQRWSESDTAINGHFCSSTRAKRMDGEKGPCVSLIAVSGGDVTFSRALSTLNIRNWRMRVKGAILGGIVNQASRAFQAWLSYQLFKGTNTDNGTGHEKENTHPCWSWPRLVWFVSPGPWPRGNRILGEPRRTSVYFWQCVIQISETWVRGAPI